MQYIKAYFIGKIALHKILCKQNSLLSILHILQYNKTYSKILSKNVNKTIQFGDAFIKTISKKS